MGTVEFNTGNYITRFAFWNPSTWAIPELYWDTFSQEQRIHAICKQLGKVIKYADYLGVNVDNIAARLKAIEDGQLDDYIVAAIEAWFEEHQPEIWEALNQLQEDVSNIEDEIGTGFDAENTIADAINTLSENTANAFEQVGLELDFFEKKIHTEPNFRCVDRFIYGDWGTDNVSAAQAGCVFVQNGLTYWAQVMNSETAGQDRLIIRNLESNTEVGRLVGQIGHGYTLSYNETTKQLITQDSESNPNTLIVIDVSTIGTPQITSIINVSGINANNYCWYDATHVIGVSGSNTWTVYDIDTMTPGTVYTDNFHGYGYGHGYIFQNACWYPEKHALYCGVSFPDGIVVCSVDEENHHIDMVDFIACKPYYGFIYMRELEFAYRCGNKMYINQFDQVDGLMVVSLLEWDMVNGTIPNENSWYIQPTGNIGFTIDYENGDLIQNSSGTAHYKLAGDAINDLIAHAGYSRGYLIFKTDYPHVVQGKSARIVITTPSSGTSVKIKGFELTACDVLWDPYFTIEVQPGVKRTFGGVEYNLAFYMQRCQFELTGGTAMTPDLVDTTGVTNPKRIYFERGEVNALNTEVVFTSDDWFRWGVANMVNASDLSAATTQRMIINTP